MEYTRIKHKGNTSGNRKGGTIKRALLKKEGWKREGRKTREQ